MFDLSTIENETLEFLKKQDSTPDVIPTTKLLFALITFYQKQG